MSYSTDGMIVTHSEGGYMGIFSTVSLLNNKIEEIKGLEAKLEIAKSALEEMRKGKGWATFEHVNHAEWALEKLKESRG